MEFAARVRRWMESLLKKKNLTWTIPLLLFIFFLIGVGLISAWRLTVIYRTPLEYKNSI